LGRFPTVHHLAEAPPAAVREAWEGLGYYRRAHNLHALAREVVTNREGLFPADPVELRQLPGVGRYTAGAIACFAFERREAAVDTNVSRVIRRAFHPRTPHTAPGEARIWKTAQALVPRRGRDAWSFNQAIMELGALVCTARVARCDACPVSSVCRTGRRSNGGKREKGTGKG
jgi:A/G-specific adenine glycosylase